VFDRKTNRRTPIALVLAVVLLGLGGVSLAAASTVPSLVREDVVVRTNPPTNLTPDDPGAMPTDAPTRTSTTEPVETTTAEPTTTETTAPTVVEPEPVETTSATVRPTRRNPVRPTDAAGPVEPPPADPVVEETTVNPVQPTTDQPAPHRHHRLKADPMFSDYPDGQLPADYPEHSVNPYAPVTEEFDTAREFLDTYLPDLVDILGFTWDAATALSSVYLAQCVVLASQQFAGPDMHTNLRALGWELSDHVRAVHYSSPIREVSVPDQAETCGCGIDHQLEANALATFLERSVEGDNGSAVKVLDALWRDTGATDPPEVLHVGASLLTHVVGAMVFARFHRDCFEQH